MLSRLLTLTNDRIPETCSSLASTWGAPIPTSSPSFSRWLKAQRAGLRNGGACCCFSAAQMARSVSGLTATMGGTLTSGYDWILQLSFVTHTPSNTCGLCGEMKGRWYWSLTKWASLCSCPFCRTEFYTRGSVVMSWTCSKKTKNPHWTLEHLKLTTLI